MPSQIHERQLIFFIARFPGNNTILGDIAYDVDDVIERELGSTHVEDRFEQFAELRVSRKGKSINDKANHETRDTHPDQNLRRWHVRQINRTDILRYVPGARPQVTDDP